VSSGSRYASADAPTSYSHRFHAGNVGDVWKHCALVEVLRRVAAEPAVAASARGVAGAHAGHRTVHYVETHAGEGRYPLAATGEWTEGIGRLWTTAVRDDTHRTDDGRQGRGAGDGGHGNDGDAGVARYVALCRRLGRGSARPETYPGSPLFARAVLGADATLTLAERDPEACRHLRATFVGDPSVDIVERVGFALLTEADRATIVLIDPPWTQKADWLAIPDALAAATAALPTATFMLWYPLKSLTRPNAMHARLEAAGVPATIAELVTTPLKHQRNRLNGSGVLLVRPPVGAVEAIAAAAPVLGQHCATRVGAWWFRMQAW